MGSGRSVSGEFAANVSGQTGPNTTLAILIVVFYYYFFRGETYSV